MALALAAVVCASAGCMRKPPPGKPGDENKSSGKELPGSALGQGITMKWQEEQQNIAPRPLLDVSAVDGKVDAATQSGRLNKATGTLYREGIAAATFQASQVQADHDEGVVVATGGVVVRSVKPQGVTVTADKVTWKVLQDRIIAQGNVHIVYLPPGAPKPAAEGGAGRMTIDTHLQRLTIP